MRTTVIATAGMMLAFLAATLQGKVLDLKTQQNILDGTEALQVEVANSTPTTVDWNNDGKKDVVCAEDEGKFFLLINEGTDAFPIFNSSPHIQSGGGTLDIGWRPSPSIVDWNEDGKKDLLCGRMQGDFMFFENKGTDAAPIFDGYVLLESNGATLDLGWDVQPWITDFNNDGTLDIVSGDRDGFVYFVEGIGPLALSANRILASTGGSIDLSLNAGAANAGRNYAIVGSVSGTTPGIPLPGGHATLPVNWDPFSEFVLSLVNTPVFPDFMGSLDIEGVATAKIDTLGPVPNAAGATLYFAYGLRGPWNFASNGAAVEIVP